MQEALQRNVTGIKDFKQGEKFDLKIIKRSDGLGDIEKSWDELKANYDERFHRMWRYYLLSCAGSFRARKNQLWQIVLSKNGIPGGYKTVR